MLPFIIFTNQPANCKLFVKQRTTCADKKIFQVRMGG